MRGEACVVVVVVVGGSLTGPDSSMYTYMIHILKYMDGGDATVDSSDCLPGRVF